MENNYFEKYILKHFSYNENGTLNRNDRKKGLGSYDKDGYLIIKVKGKQFKSHRIVWFLNYGYFPKEEIDHINRIRTDNRIENLRETDRLGNIKNMIKKINKDTGVVGIHIDKTKGLKKKYTFKYKNKTYRNYSVEEAIKERKELGYE